MNPRIIKLVGTFIFLFFSCQNDDEAADANPEVIAPLSCEGDICDMLTVDEVRLNPSGYAPLSAIITLEATEIIRVNILVNGNNGEDSDLIHNFSESGTALQVPIHGLYPDFENIVTLTFFNTEGLEIGITTYMITTLPLISDMPQISIDTAERSAMAAGMTLVSYYGFNQAISLFRPFMFDSYGDIRWYLDYQSHPILGSLDYDNGPNRLVNGNFYFADQASNAIYEIDLFGNILDTWEIPGYRFHHEVLEKPNGNFLVTVDKEGENTIEDYIIEIDRNSKQIILEWNLNESLSNTRTTLTDNARDWIHVNGISYDKNDDTIVISGRTQGVIKLTSDNEVVWIMGSHKNWGISGNGIDLNQFLLQPLDGFGNVISNQAILDGDENHADFEWNWYQHATKVLPNGNIILFDNGGDNRNFGATNLYSRAVEFKIENGTIQQVWDYGKEGGLDTYSRIVSDVDYLANVDHMLFSPGNIIAGPQPVGKSIEINISDDRVIFEATITPPTAFNDQITFHRTDRLTLYAN